MGDSAANLRQSPVTRSRSRVNSGAAVARPRTRRSGWIRSLPVLDHVVDNLDLADVLGGAARSHQQLAVAATLGEQVASDDVHRPREKAGLSAADVCGVSGDLDEIGRAHV